MMNYYQQNNSLTQFTSINIVNVTFYVVAESNISNLLTTLKVNFAEFDRLLNHKMSANEIKRKAIEVNSKIQVLADSIGEVGYEKRDEFVKKLIESSIAVSERYVEAEKKLKDLAMNYATNSSPIAKIYTKIILLIA